MKAKINTKALKEKNLKQAVQGSKLVKLSYNQSYNLAEIASIAGISEKTARNKKELVEKYWSEESKTPDEDREFIRKRAIVLAIRKKTEKSEKPSTGEKLDIKKKSEKSEEEEPSTEKKLHIKNSLRKSDNISMDDMFGIILSSYLKTKTNLLDEAESLLKVWTVGQHISKIHSMVCRYKSNKKGAQIHSETNKSAKYLLNSKNISKSNLDRLFDRSKDYIVGGCSRRWRLTGLLKTCIEKTNKELLDTISNSNIDEALYLKAAFSRMFHVDDNAKGPFFIVYTDLDAKFITAPLSIIRQFDPNSQSMLLKEATKITKDTIQIKVVHRGKGDAYLGRNYNVFCSIHSHERLELGYISYDMSAAMQSICLGLIKAKEEDYPTIWKYAYDKEHKKKMRLEVAQALGIKEDDVKKKLTAFANGAVSKIDDPDYCRVFQKESVKLRREVMKYVSIHEPDVLKKAREQSRKAKYLLKEEPDWLDTETQETLREMRGKSSIFFFVWTWYEREVRQAMLDVLEEGIEQQDSDIEPAIEVHDAVYSKSDITVERLQDAIKTRTNFDIIIERRSL